MPLPSASFLFGALIIICLCAAAFRHYINSFSSWLIRVRSVSYTHLDVYKRQGVDIAGLYAMNKSLAVSADAGYTGLVGKKYFPSISLIPIRVGMQYLSLIHI